MNPSCAVTKLIEAIGVRPVCWYRSELPARREEIRTAQQLRDTRAEQLTAMIDQLASLFASN